MKRSYMTTFEGIVPNLERRYRETDSEYIREKIEEYMSERPCPACQGARLKPATLAVRIGGLNIYELSLLPVAGAARFLDELDLSQRERLIGVRVLKEIKERLSFLESVGVGYLSPPAVPAACLVGRHSASAWRPRSVQVWSAFCTSWMSLP